MAGEARSVVVRLSMDTAQAIAASKEFGAEMSRSMAQAEKSTHRSRAAMDQLGGTAGKMGLAAAAGVFAIERSTANFDEAMSHVAATGEDARASYDQLRQAAIEAGAATAFSATEAAGGIENLAKAGVSAQDILGGGLTGSLDLAAAGGLDVANAAEIAATALTQFKLSGEDVPHVADLLAAAAGKAQGDVSDMSMALKQSGLVASQMGLSLEETTGTLAAFASAGLLGSDAGTSFRTMLLRLANATPKAQKEMDRLGIAAYDAGGQFVGMASLAGQLQAALQDKTQAERDSAMATIFGSDAIRAASVLYDQGADGITRWTTNVNDAGYAAETAATRMDNLKGDIEQFMGSLETALIGAGEGSQGALRGMVQDATKAVNVFNDLPPELQGTVTQLLAITAITGGAGWFGSKAVRGISDTRDALENLRQTAPRTAAAIKALNIAGGVAAVFYTLAQGIDAVEKSTDEAIPGVEGLTRNLLDLGTAKGFEGLVGDVGDLRGKLDTLHDSGFWGDVDSLYDKVPAGFGTLSHAIPILGGHIADADQKTREAAASVDVLDQALAGIVTAGSADQAAEILDKLAESYGLNKTQVEELVSRLPKYQEALDGAANSTELATSATGDFGVKARTVADEVNSLNKVIDEQRKAARGTAEEFVGLADSLDDSKVSLGEWIRDLEKQAKALKNFRLNAEEAADKGLRQGLIDALEEAGPAGALRMKQLANATEAEIKRVNRAWQSGQHEIEKFTDDVGGVPTDVSVGVDVDTFDAMRAVAKLQNALAQVQSKDVEVRVHYMNFGNKLAGMAADGHAGADGMTVPGQRYPYGDKTLIWAAPGEEVITNRHGEADRFRADRAAGRIPAYADGGAVGYANGGEVRSLDDRLAIAQTLQEIRDLRRDLARDGKQRLSGIDRRIAELQLEAAERELRLTRTREAREARAAAREQAAAIRQIGAGLSFDSLVPGQPQTVAQGVAAEIQDFWQQIFEAGGTIDSAMLSWAADMVAAAKAYDETVAAIEAETKKRDDLAQTLSEQQSQLDQLNSTMEAFASSVASNFTGSPFSRTSLPRSAPGQSALEQQLAAAQAAGDAAAASRLMQQIALAQSSGAGLEALRASVEGDIADAEAFTAALAELASKGLDTTGPLGALYAQLAASGDVVTAQDLAALSADQVDQWEKLFATREDAAATAGALATQAMYGEQHAVLVAAVDQSTAAIQALDATITVLEATQAVLGEQVRAGAEAGAAALHPDLVALKTAIDELPRKLQHLQRGAGGR